MHEWRLNAHFSYYNPCIYVSKFKSRKGLTLIVFFKCRNNAILIWFYLSCSNMNGKIETLLQILPFYKSPRVKVKCFRGGAGAASWWLQLRNTDEFLLISTAGLPWVAPSIYIPCPNKEQIYIVILETVYDCYMTLTHFSLGYCLRAHLGLYATHSPG
jgi:hypothetical protein